MKCFKCDSDREAAFFQENFPCGHCEERNLIEYNICPDCGWMWRSVNETPLEDSQMSTKDLDDLAGIMMGENEMFDQSDLSEEEAAIMDNIGAHIAKIGKMEKGEATMADYVHKCLQCNSTAIDVDDGTYKCMDCGFEWEIVKFE